MQPKLNPYLSFNDNARPAMEFYQSVFGGQLELHTFEEYQSSKDPADANKIMHAVLTADNGMTFMAADTPASMEYQAGSNISMSLSGDQEAELTGYFEKLSAGGVSIMPLNKAEWGDTFGMCVDKFGTQWMVSIAPAK